jgi:hypothetical protein
MVGRTVKYIWEYLGIRDKVLLGNWENRIVEFLILNGQTHTKKIKEKIKIPNGTVYRELRKLVALGLVEEANSQYYVKGYRGFLPIPKGREITVKPEVLDFFFDRGWRFVSMAGKLAVIAYEDFNSGYYPQKQPSEMIESLNSESHPQAKS